MRIMLDTNILISMLFFPSEQFKQTLNYITRNHKLVLSSFVIDELFAVADRKFSSKKHIIDSFLSNLTYELVYTPYNIPGKLFEIRDVNDYPVLWKNAFKLYPEIAKGICNQ